MTCLSESALSPALSEGTKSCPESSTHRFLYLPTGECPSPWKSVLRWLFRTLASCILSPILYSFWKSFLWCGSVFQMFSGFVKNRIVSHSPCILWVIFQVEKGEYQLYSATFKCLSSFLFQITKDHVQYLKTTWSWAFYANSALVFLGISGNFKEVLPVPQI